MKNGEIECISCNNDVAKHREEAGMALCDICAPWVESSLKRTGEIPSWAPSFCDVRQDMFYETRKAITKLSTIREGRGHWSLGEGTPCPITEHGWKQFLEWVLRDDEEPSVPVHDDECGVSLSRDGEN